MAEFEEKLSSILGDQNAMSQIMALAQSLSGGGEHPPGAQPSSPPSRPLPWGSWTPGCSSWAAASCGSIRAARIKMPPFSWP